MKYNMAKFHIHLSEEDKKKRDEENKRIREEYKKKREEELVDIRRRQQEYIKKFIEEHPDYDQKLIRRFFSKVDIKRENDCWNWLANQTKIYGYGRFRCNKMELAHRISYILKYGKISNDILVCHICNNKLCINPNHLFLGTWQDNMNDMINKKRSLTGEKHFNSKLTWKIIRKIREEYSKNETTYYKLSKKYNISDTVIGYIINNQIWKE